MYARSCSGLDTARSSIRHAHAGMHITGSLGQMYLYAFSVVQGGSGVRAFKQEARSQPRACLAAAVPAQPASSVPCRPASKSTHTAARTDLWLHLQGGIRTGMISRKDAEDACRESCKVQLEEELQICSASEGCKLESTSPCHRRAAAS